ncbi:MAG: hypothetical protein KDA32_14985, partial [Phycisphaerales bacterium]|nr:hypothetical protein [Phycisphaerales bacterium]
MTDNLTISQSTLDGVNLALTELRLGQLVDSTFSRVLVTDSEIARGFDASKQEIIVVPIPTRRCERVALVAESLPEYRAKWVFSRGMAIDRVIMFRDPEGGCHNVATIGSAKGVGWESYRDYTDVSLTMALVGLVVDYMRWNCGQLQ